MSRHTTDKRGSTISLLNKLFQIKKTYSKLIDGEIHYKYIKKDWQKYQRAVSMFGDGNHLVTKEELRLFIDNIERSLQKIQSLEQKILDSFDKNTPTYNKIIQESLRELQEKFHLFRVAAPIEAMKWWLNLSDKKRKFYNKHIEVRIEVFWENSRKKPKEVGFYLAALKDLIDRNSTKKTLTQHELHYLQQVYLDILEQSDYKMPKYKVSFFQNKKHSLLNEISISHTKQYRLFKKLSSKISSASDYELEIKTSELVSNASIDNHTETMYLPSKSLEPNISIWLAIGRYEHEIKHYYNGKRTEQYFWLGFTGANYLELEEWVASILTALGKWEIYTIADLKRYVKVPRLRSLLTFICEYYNRKDAIRIGILIQKALEWSAGISDSNWDQEDNIEHIERIEDTIRHMIDRAKRFRDPSQAWSNSKDMAYPRWRTLVAKYLWKAKSEKELQELFHNLNTFKLSYTDSTCHLDSLFKELRIRESNLPRSSYLALWIQQTLYELLNDSWRKSKTWLSVSNSLLKKIQYDSLISFSTKKRKKIKKKHQKKASAWLQKKIIKKALNSYIEYH